MRPHYYFSFLFLLISICFVSCKKDEASDPDTGPASFTISSLDGNQWTADTISAEYRNGIVLIMAQTDDGKRIGFSAKVNATGEYSFNDDAVNPFIMYDKNDGAVPYTSLFISSSTQTGILKITKFDQANALISGELSCKIRPGQNVTPILDVTDLKFENIKLGTLDPSSQILTATIPSSIGYSGFFVSAYLRSFDPVIEISGISADGGSGFSIALSKNVNPGTYNLTSFLGGAVPSANVTTGSDLYDTLNGTVKVTTHDKTARKIAGTFSFTGISLNTFESISITNGTFNVKY